jgi:hypothetical protein
VATLEHRVCSSPTFGIAYCRPSPPASRFTAGASGSSSSPNHASGQSGRANPCAWTRCLRARACRLWRETPGNQRHLASCVGFRTLGSSAFGACLHARISSFLPALVAFAATPRDDVGQVIAAVIVGNLRTDSDVLDGAYDDLVAYRVGLGIGPARMICVSSEILSSRSVNRPTVASSLSACLFVSLRPLYSTMKAPFWIGAVAKGQDQCGSGRCERFLAGHNHAFTTIRVGQPDQRGKLQSHL